MNNNIRLLLISVLVFVVSACAPQPPAQVHLQGATMGTTYNVKFSEAEQVDPAVVQADIDALLAHINKLMSTYDPESELSRFNQQQSTQPFALSPETALVLEEAIRLGEMSQGVLDVTVGPLVNLWGFGPQARPEKVPTQAVVDETRLRIGLDKLNLTAGSLSKANPELYVDLSTIAKGYGVDAVAELLIERDITDFLVEIGGEMRVAGKKGNGKDWVIAVEKPLTTERAIQQFLVIGDNAIATAGDYRNYFEENGVRYSHLIDPRTGFPIQHNLVAVTVVHPSSMTADGLATALNVMGKDQALALAEEQNLAVLLITRENGEFKEYTSASFAGYIQSLN